MSDWEGAQERWSALWEQRRPKFQSALDAAMGGDEAGLREALERLGEKSEDEELHARAHALSMWLMRSAPRRSRLEPCVGALLERLDSSLSFRKGAPSPLHLAAYCGAVVFDATLARASRLEGRTGAGATPLMFAAFNYGSHEAALALLEAGAGVERVDEKGRSALDYSARSFAADAPRTGRLLIMSGARWEEAMETARQEANDARAGAGRQEGARAWIAAAEAAILEREQAARMGLGQMSRARAL